MTSPYAARRRPPGRYDPPSVLGARLTAVALSVLLIALLAAIGTGLYARFRGEDVRARVIDFQVLSDRRVRVDVEVLKPKGSRAYCLVRSRGRDGSEVGREIVAFDTTGSAERVVRREHDLTTRARANTGEVGRCSATPVPSRSPAP